MVALSSSGGSGEGALSQLAVGELCMVEVVGESRIGKIATAVGIDVQGS